MDQQLIRAGFQPPIAEFPEGKLLPVRRMRKASAGLLAALYALFLLIPQAAVAAIPSGGAVHCLSEALEPPPAIHGHHDVGQATDHRDATSTNDTTHNHSADQECCGLFGLNMLLPPSAEAVAFKHQSSAPLLPGAAFVLSGRSPLPVDRPPRHLLNV